MLLTLHKNIKKYNKYIISESVWRKKDIYEVDLIFRKYSLSAIEEKKKPNTGIISLKAITMKVNSAKKYFKTYSLMDLDYAPYHNLQYRSYNSFIQIQTAHILIVIWVFFIILTT